MKKNKQVIRVEVIRARFSKKGVSSQGPIASHAKRELSGIYRRAREDVNLVGRRITPSATKPQLKIGYFAQRREGRKGKAIPNFAFLASWRE
jgi:hypothetical protein